MGFNYVMMMTDNGNGNSLQQYAIRFGYQYTPKTTKSRHRISSSPVALLSQLACLRVWTDDEARGFVDRSHRGKLHMATIKVRNASAVPEVLRELGADVAQVLQSAGIEPEVFSNPENTLPFSALSRLVSECVKATGCEDFGLRCGAKRGATAIGLAGLVSINSPTVRDGLQVIVANLKASNTGARVVFDVRNAIASLAYVITAPNIESADQISDAAIARLYKTMRELCGRGWRPSHVFLTRIPPRNLQPFSQFFEAPISFSAPEASLTFNANVLDRPVQNQNPEYRDVLSPLLDEAVAKVSSDFVSDVKSILRTQLAARPLTQSRAASALGLSARTFTRRLQTSRITFSDIADQVKFEVAQSLLLKDKKIGEIATILGFANPSAFTRAFKQWSGKAPARWRVEQDSPQGRG